MVALGRICDAAGEVTDIIKRQIVRDGTSDGDFRAHVNENRDCAEGKIRMFPNRVVYLLATVVFGSLDARQLKNCKQYCQQDEHNRKKVNVEFDHGVLRSGL